MAQQGTVMFWDRNRGYGFIAPVWGGGSSLFVHATAVEKDGNGERVLQPGQLVEFEIGEGRKGPQAESVVVIGWAEERAG